MPPELLPACRITDVIGIRGDRSPFDYTVKTAVLT